MKFTVYELSRKATQKPHCIPSFVTPLGVVSKRYMCPNPGTELLHEERI